MKHISPTTCTSPTRMNASAGYVVLADAQHVVAPIVS